MCRTVNVVADIPLLREEGCSGMQPGAQSDRTGAERIGELRRGRSAPAAVGNAKKNASLWGSTSTPP